LNSPIRNNSSLLIKRLPTFNILNLFNFIQNLIKNRVNLDAYWCKAMAPWGARWMHIGVWQWRHGVQGRLSNGIIFRDLIFKWTCHIAIRDVNFWLISPPKKWLPLIHHTPI
jgi:hypothetical protein